jgi:hypothetical protein
LAAVGHRVDDGAPETLLGPYDAGKVAMRALVDLVRCLPLLPTGDEVRFAINPREERHAVPTE